MPTPPANPSRRLQDLPNIGPAMIKDFTRLKIRTPEDLKMKNAYELYDELCRLTKKRHDPCVLDTFLAVIDFVNGAPKRPWWHYTAERKRNWNWKG